MPWVKFSLALLATFLLQTTLVRVMRIEYVDLLLVMALLCGLLAPLRDARIAAWIVGFTQDLGSLGALGIHALALGFTGLILTTLRELVNLKVWWVRLLICLAAALPGQFVYTLHFGLQAETGGAAWTAALASSLWISLIASISAAAITGIPRVYRKARLGKLSTARR